MDNLHAPLPMSGKLFENVPTRTVSSQTFELELKKKLDPCNHFDHQMWRAKTSCRTMPLTRIDGDVDHPTPELRMIRKLRPQAIRL